MDGVYVIFILMVHHLSFFLYVYILEDLYYASYCFYNPITWFSGITIYFFLTGTAFMGYVLPNGQMSL